MTGRGQKAAPVGKSGTAGAADGSLFLRIDPERGDIGAMLASLDGGSIGVEVASPARRSSQFRLEEGRVVLVGGNPARFAAGKVLEVEMPLPEGGTLALDGLIASPTNPVAVINGRLLSRGDIVQGFEVLSIGAESVEIERDGRRYTLALR